MAGNVSNWSIFIGGDASGGVEALRMTATEADLAGKHIAEVGKRASESRSGFEAMADGIRRVAKQQELLDAQRTKAAASGAGRRGLDPLAASMGRFSHERLVGGTSEPGAEIRLQDEQARRVASLQNEVATERAIRDNAWNAEKAQTQKRHQEAMELSAHLKARLTADVANEVAAERAIRDNAWNEEKARTQKRHQEAMELSAHLKERLTAEVANEVATERAIRDNAWNEEKLAAQIHAKQMADLKADILRRNQPVASAMIAGMSGAGATQAASGSMMGQLNNWQQLQSARDAAFADEQAGYQAERVLRAQALDAKARDAAHEQQIDMQSRTVNVQTRNQEIEDEIEGEIELRLQRARALDARARDAAHEQQIDINTRRVNAQTRNQEIQDEIDATAEIAAQRARRVATAAARTQAHVGQFNAGAFDAYATRVMGPMPQELNMAQQAIANMRAQMTPMVGMQQRLAEEARNVRNYLREQVVLGRMTLNEAQAQVVAYQQQSQALMHHAQQQQAGFLGMRRMGFAAQQFGYAIEDAASVYGTMGLAGAFRAAGNNLTVMAAQAGPVAGFVASLASAAIALGINFYNAAQEAKKLKEQVERIKQITDDLNDRWKTHFELQGRISDLQHADHSQRMAAFDQTIAKLREIQAMEDARVKTNEQLLELIKLQNQQKMLQGQIDEKNAEWWEKAKGWGIGTGIGQLVWLYDHSKDFVRETATGLMQMTETADSLRIKEEKFNADAKAEIAMNRQEAIAKRMNSYEQKTLDNLKERLAILSGNSRHMPSPGDTPEDRAEKRSEAYADSKEYDPRGKNRTEVLTRSMKGARMSSYVAEGLSRDDRGHRSGSSAEDLLHIQERILDSIREQKKISEDVGWNKHTTDEKLKATERELELRNELYRVQQMSNALDVAGLEDKQRANDSIMARFEALNDTLRIENESERVQKAINDQLEVAELSGALTWEQADKYREELESVLKLEEELRNNDKEIERLQKREGTLEGLARQALTPATVQAGLVKGSDEARAFLENERLKSMAQKDAEPQIKELREIRAAIKALQKSNEKIGQSRPAVATLF